MMSNELLNRAKASTVTAIVPTYNRVHFIREGLNSLLMQSRRIDQIIVVDDGSTDGTEEVIRQCFPKIEYLRKENGGKSAALNFALPFATGEYIWICDDDDVALPDALSLMLSALENNPQADYVVGTYKVMEPVSNTQWVIGEPHISKRPEEPNLKINLLENMFTLQYASLTRRKVYEELKGYNETLVRSQDYDMILRISRNYQGVEITNPIFLYRQHDGDRGSAGELLSSKKNQLRWLNYNKIIFEDIWKNYDLYEFVPTFAIGTDREERAAFLQRALIMANRTLWDQASSDLNQAELQSTLPLCEQELQLLKAIVHGREPWIALTNNKAALANLSKVFSRSEHGQKMIAALLRPFLWDTKNSIKRNPFAAARCFRVLFSIAGFRLHKIVSKKHLAV